MSDVFYGRIWSEFQNYDGEPFLSTPFSLGLMMNFDFFQTYKHVPYSVDAIYLVIMNLPRSVHFQQENVMLVGILPGPHEPSKDINSYLNPFVDELLLYLEGIYMNVDGFVDKQKIRCALLCVTSDIPAGRKACGFVGHNAHYGCTKCLKKFTSTIGNMNFSGFDHGSWQTRTVNLHKEAVRCIMNCSTKTSQQKIESETGFHYSFLLRLPYFDSTRMLVIDPMHNLYLGSAKHNLKAIWIDKLLLSSDNLYKTVWINVVYHQISEGSSLRYSLDFHHSPLTNLNTGLFIVH